MPLQLEKLHFLSPRIAKKGRIGENNCIKSNSLAKKPLSAQKVMDIFQLTLMPMPHAADMALLPVGRHPPMSDSHGTVNKHCSRNFASISGVDARGTNCGRIFAFIRRIGRGVTLERVKADGLLPSSDGTERAQRGVALTEEERMRGGSVKNQTRAGKFADIKRRRLQLMLTTRDAPCRLFILPSRSV